MRKKILFISHIQKQCGVHQFGKNIASAITGSSLYDFVYAECSGFEDLNAAITSCNPVAIIYNYYSSTMPWLQEKVVHKLYHPLNRYISIPQIGIMHEVTQEKADHANNYLFDYHIAPDPTLLLKNPIVYKTGRLVPQYENNFPLPKITTIGSFGFATPNKGFEDIVRAVNSEFDEAIIRFNIPFADFGDKEGNNAVDLVERCRKLITKAGINLVVSHEFLDQEQVLDFLARNSINVFLYQDKIGRGIASAADYALAADRPLAVSESIMFRHLRNSSPSIIYGKRTLKQILHQDIGPLKKIKMESDTANIVWEYDRIITSIFSKENNKTRNPAGILSKAKNFIRQAIGRSGKTFTWLRNTEAESEDSLNLVTAQSYRPLDLPGSTSFNRILDNNARKLYAPAVDKLMELAPLTMAKKIAEANVQQGFVFDSVIRFAATMNCPKLLCVGSYEDTAAMSLKKLGYSIDEIDPVLNYYLQEYVSKPSVVPNSYDIIFSTSVIEHDPDDESFIRCISDLLAPGGIAVLTCDYNDQWKEGIPKPEVDVRLYTQKDLRQRLLPLMKNCVLVDEPQWDCPNPDFLYLNKYRYTFATFVVRKEIV